MLPMLPSSARHFHARVALCYAVTGALSTTTKRNKKPVSLFFSPCVGLLFFIHEGAFFRKLIRKNLGL